MIDVTTYISLLEKPENISSTEVINLEKVLKEYPYFQSAHFLHLSGLKKQNSYAYNKYLKITAAHTTDRSILFDHISKPQHQFSKPVIVEEKVKTRKTTVATKTSAETLELGKPLSFSKSEVHSFNEWLQLDDFKEIRREKKTVDEKAIKSTIIDRFIASNPKITPVKKDRQIEAITNQETTDKDSLMTETLAKVYLEQKKYEYAIKAYRILSLKYPEKSSFFADQIKAIQNLEKK